MLTKEKQIIVCIEIQEGLSGRQSPDRESIPEEHTAWDSLGQLVLSAPPSFTPPVTLCTSGIWRETFPKPKKHFSAPEDCQNYLSEVCLAHLLTIMFHGIFTCKKTLVSDLDL